MLDAKMYLTRLEEVKAELQRLYTEKERLLKELKEIGEEYAHGSVVQKYVRCGKENCVCTRGRLYGPYYYLGINGKWIRIDNKEEIEKRKRAKEITRRLKEIDKKISKLVRRLNIIFEDIIASNKLSILTVPVIIYGP